MAADLIDKLFQMNPKERLGAEDNGGYALLKSHPWFDGIDFDTINESKRPDLTIIEIQSRDICENYLFVGKEYHTPILELEENLLQVLITIATYLLPTIS